MFLAWQAGILNGVVAAFPVIENTLEMVRGTGGGLVTPTRDATIQEAARPLSIVITDSAGERFGVRNNTELRDDVYNAAGGILGDALGSASAHTQVTEGEWRQALSGSSFFFEYITPIRLSVLRQWLGMEGADTAYDVEIRRMFVSFGEERSRIYFQDHNSGLHFGADTGLVSSRAYELGVFAPNGAMFAFESGLRGYESAPYLLILQDVYHLDIQSAVAGSQQEILELGLNLFNHMYEAPPTNFSGEALMGFGTNFNLRVDPDGRMIYRWTSETLRGDISEPSIGEMIEVARDLVADSIAQMCGEAEVMFESIEYNEGLYSVIFGFYFAGGRIYLYDDRPAAEVTFDSGNIIEAELNFRSFVPAGTLTRLMPQRQAFAAAGGEFILTYLDTGAQVLYPSWVRVWF